MTLIYAVLLIHLINGLQVLNPVFIIFASLVFIYNMFYYEVRINVSQKLRLHQHFWLSLSVASLW